MTASCAAVIAAAVANFLHFLMFLIIRIKESKAHPRSCVYTHTNVPAYTCIIVYIYVSLCVYSKQYL